MINITCAIDIHMEISVASVLRTFTVRSIRVLGKDDSFRHVFLNVVLLGDFNIDMQKSNPAWDSTISLFGLDQMITSPTRISPHSSTLINHIYTSDTSIVSNILVPATGISDNFPVCCTLSVKTVKPVLNVHSSIV